MMKINIKATNITLDPKIHKYVEDTLLKVEKAVSEIEDEIVCEVEIGKDSMHHESGNVYKSEIQLYFMGKKLRNVASSPDIYQAINLSRDGVFQEIIKRKDKKETLIRKGGRIVKDTMRRFYR